MAVHEKQPSMSTERLTDHIIICGGTPLALMAAEAVRKAGRPLALVSTRFPEAREYSGMGESWREGDPADDAALLEVGVRNAYGLICAVDDDRESLFVTTTARYLNPHMQIVAWASDPDMRNKLLLAGASRVVWSSHVVGMRMASEMIRPVTVKLLDAMIKEQSVDPQIGHVEVQRGSPLDGKALGQARILSRLGLLVAAIGKRGGGQLVYDPSASTRIEAEDLLVVFGKQADIEKLRGILAGRTSCA